MHVQARRGGAGEVGCPQSGGTAAGQKAESVLSAGPAAPSTRPVQSTALMSQKLHSWWLGTVLGCVSLDSLWIRVRRSCIKLVWGQRPGQRVEVEHDLDGVPRPFTAGFDVDDQDVVAVHDGETGVVPPGWRLCPGVERLLGLGEDVLAAG